MDRQTGSDAYEPNVQFAQVGSKTTQNLPHATKECVAVVIELYTKNVAVSYVGSKKVHRPLTGKM